MLLLLLALYAQTGQFGPAKEHALRSFHLDPTNAMNLRNLAHIQSATGDSRAALASNRRAIAAEDGLGHGRDARVFRNAAVQTFVQGGGIEKGEWSQPTLLTIITQLTDCLTN